MSSARNGGVIGTIQVSVTEAIDLFREAGTSAITHVTAEIVEKITFLSSC